MTAGRPSPVFISGIALVILGALVLPSALAKPKPNHKPDLAVKHADIQGKGFALIGRRADIEVKDTIENVGKAKAGPTVNEVRIHGHGKHFEHTSRAVPAIEPGKENEGKGTARIDIPDNAEPGKYAITLCADAKDQENEEDELDNCKTLGRLLPHRAALGGGTLKVTGHASGTRRQGGRGHERRGLQRSGGSRSPRIVQVHRSNGSVTYTDSGSDSGGCHFSGRDHRRQSDGEPVPLL